MTLPPHDDQVYLVFADKIEDFLVVFSDAELDLQFQVIGQP